MGVNDMLLKFGSRGALVKKYKDMLFALKYLHASTHDRFGKDTEAAVKAFQKKNNLKADGIIGNKTGPAIVLSYEYKTGMEGNDPQTPQITQYLVPADYPNISAAVITSINADLQDETAERIAIIKEALRWVFPYALYIFGANLYKPDLTVTVPTPAYIDARAKSRPQYFTGGRKDFMKKQYALAVKEGRRIGCADCSGFVVGILRKLKMVKSSFDTTANGLYHSYCKGIKKADLKPADLIFKRSSSGHIPHVGMYVGAGYTIEAAGGAYGVQMSQLNNHIIINQMTKAKEKHAAWKVFGDPKLY
jgi:cell wall-associated NlpC family hydrolase